MNMSMERKETPQDRYHKAHTVSVAIRIMKNTEQDIIKKLDSVPNHERQKCKAHTIWPNRLTIVYLRAKL